ADPGNDGALLVSHGDAPRQHRMPTTVNASETMLHVPRGARLHALLPGRDGLFDVVGMQQVGPAEVGTLLLSHADQLQERLAAVNVSPLGVANPDAVVDRLPDGA